MTTRRRDRGRSTDPLRVALVSPSLMPGGAQRQMLILAEGLARAGVELRFILLAERGALAVEADALGIPVHVLGLTRSRLSPWARFAELARALRDYRRLTRDVDIVDAWLVPALTFVGLAQPVLRVPVFVAGRRSLSDVARPRTRLRRAGAAIAMRRAHAIVANSIAGRADLISREGMDAARVHVIPNAVVAPEPSTREPVRSEWGIGRGAVVVGCVANLQPGKGVLQLVDVAAALRPSNPELRWVFVGDGPLRGAIEGAIRERALDGVAIVRTDISDARAVYPAFDLVVQASDSEGLPNAVLEAAAASLPIVATSVGGTAEIIEDGRTGLLVPPRDPAALAAAIGALAGDATRRHVLGAAAADRALDYSPERLVSSTLRLYLALTGRDAS